MRSIKLPGFFTYSIVTIISLFSGALILIYAYQPDYMIDYSSVLIPSNKVAIYGDSRTNHEIHQKVILGILSKKPIYTINTGDLVDDGASENQWSTFNKITEKLRAETKLYSAIGNHEKNSSLYFDNFTFPGNERWYSFDVSNIRFYVLDSGSSLVPESEQYNWLVNEFKNTPGTKKKMIIMHHPIYNSGEHELDELGLRVNLVPLLKQNKVSAVISGHDHDYERSYSDGIYYIVTGGGGAPLYVQTRQIPESQKFISIHHYMVLRVTKDKLRLTVYGLDGATLDQVEIN